MRAARALGHCAALAALLIPNASRADDDGLEHRTGLGIELAPFGRPTGHLGIPLGGAQSAPHMAAEIVGRWQANRNLALTFGLGLQHAGLGNGIRVGSEVFARVVGDRGGVVALELYGDPGLQLGFAGPDYFARHSNAFVNYLYATEGPVAFGLRLPAGLRLSWSHHRLDTYVEEIPIVLFTPVVDALFEVGTGVRARF